MSRVVLNCIHCGEGYVYLNEVSDPKTFICANCQYEIKHGKFSRPTSAIKFLDQNRALLNRLKFVDGKYLFIVSCTKNIVADSFEEIIYKISKASGRRPE